MDALRERDYRLAVDSLEKAAKQGGQSRMFELPGASRGGIRAGMAEATALAEGRLAAAQFKERVREPDAGRKPIDTVYPKLSDAAMQSNKLSVTRHTEIPRRCCCGQR